MALNRIVLQGRLTSDPTLRHTQQGTAVASFALAVDRDGKEKATDFIDCVAWKGTAEFINNYFSKGRMAVVDGRLQIREWTDKDGNKRRTAEVVVGSVHFCDSKKEDPLDRFTKEHPDTVGTQFAELGDDDGTLPF